jgi:hypothetical protein
VLSQWSPNCTSASDHRYYKNRLFVTDTANCVLREVVFDDASDLRLGTLVIMGGGAGALVTWAESAWFTLEANVFHYQ